MPRPNLRSGWSALRNSIIAYSPYYAAPTESLLEPSNLVGTSVLATVNPPITSQCNYRSGIVSRANRRNGMREMYSRGTQRNSTMRMMATGAVESTRYQPRLGWTWTGSFNDALYEAGYPQNLGLSFKAPSIPDGVATSAQWGRMRAAPQFTRTVFTRRRFAGAPSIAAQPTQR
jgi:hypothetical protein